MLEWITYVTFISLCACVAARVIERSLRALGREGRWVWMVTACVIVVVAVGVAIRPAHDATRVALVPEVQLLVAPPRQSNLSQTPFVVGLWLVMTVGFAGVVLRGVRDLARARQRARFREIDGVAIAVTSTLGPGVTAFGQPRIVVPAWFETLVPSDQLLLLRHEQEHVIARDPQWLLFATCLLLAMPWNVGLWYLVHRLRRAIELDCDARVLHARSDVRRYAELLLTVAARRSRVPFDAMLAFSPSPRSLRERIVAMTGGQRLSRAQYAYGALPLPFAIAVACSVEAPAPIAPVTSMASVAPRPVAEAPMAKGTTHRDSLVVLRRADGGEVRLQWSPSTIKAVPLSAIQAVEVAKGGRARSKQSAAGRLTFTLRDPVVQGAGFTVVPDSIAESKVAQDSSRAKNAMQGRPTEFILRAADGRELARELPGTIAKPPEPQRIGGLEFSTNDIQSVEVVRAPTQGTVTVFMRPGTVLKKRSRF